MASPLEELIRAEVQRLIRLEHPALTSLLHPIAPQDGGVGSGAGESDGGFGGGNTGSQVGDGGAMGAGSTGDSGFAGTGSQGDGGSIAGAGGVDSGGVDSNAGVDSMTPSYLTIGTDGSVSADFSGKISAQGVVLPSDTSTDNLGTDPKARIQWDRASDGALLASLHTADLGASGGSELNAWAVMPASGEGGATGTYGAISSSENQNAYIEAQITSSGRSKVNVAATQTPGGPTYVKQLLADDGTSDYAWAGLGVGYANTDNPSSTTWPSISALLSTTATVKKPNGAAVLVMGGMSCYANAVGALLHQYAQIDTAAAVETARFYFNQANVHMWCGSWAYVYYNVSPGTHTFYILAYDEAAICYFSNGYDSCWVAAIELP